MNRAMYAVMKKDFRGIISNRRLFLELLPQGSRTGGVEMAVTGLILNYILPVFFLMIPIMTASIMAASSFVGEKEKHTLETLLYCPLYSGSVVKTKI